MSLPSTELQLTIRVSQRPRIFGSERSASVRRSQDFLRICVRRRTRPPSAHLCKGRAIRFTDAWTRRRASQRSSDSHNATDDHDTIHTHTHTHTFSDPLSRTTRVSRHQKGKPIWIFVKQETESGSGISWAICKPAHRSRQITTTAPHRSVFYRPDALPVAQPTASKH